MAEQMPRTSTLCMIKPDAVGAGNAAAIEKCILDAGFVIVAKKRFEACYLLPRQG